MNIWKLPRSEVRSCVLDPIAKLGFPHRASDATYLRRFTERVARNVAEREERKPLPALLQRQAI